MPLMNHALIRPLSLALGLFAAAVHGQEERWYQVELMIFSHVISRIQDAGILQ